MKTDTFTVIPKDNLDINAKSSGASQHFHGTCMSVLQFPKADELTPVPPIQFDSTTSTSKKVGHLPELYASLKPINKVPCLPFKKPLSLPVCRFNIQIPCSTALAEAFGQEIEWIEEVIFSPDVGTSKSWSQYHSEKDRGDCSFKGINAILPLISKVVHTIETQYHCMTIIRKTITKLNPGQTPVDVSDQPVYSLSKEIQYRFSDEFGEGKYFVMFGALHIEKSLLVLHGDIIRGSGLLEILQTNELSVMIFSNKLFGLY